MRKRPQSFIFSIRKKLMRLEGLSALCLYGNWKMYTGAVAPSCPGIKHLPPSGFMQACYIYVTDLPETDSLINTVDNFVHFSVIICSF